MTSIGSRDALAATSAPVPTSFDIAHPAFKFAARFAWLIAPIVCHFSFSWIGFNPTDDGWLQAVARRLADGEVPHRDFIFVRPALSALLQVPLVWWGGDYIIWWSRLWGWMSLAAICWLWSGRVVADTTRIERHLFYVTALFLCAHTFPVMAWHSIDAMLLSTIAVMLLDRNSRWSQCGAFFAVGLAALCRQNFALFAPWLLLASGLRPARWLGPIVCAALPVLLYLTVMFVCGGALDFIQQVGATGTGVLLNVGFLHYVYNPWFLLGAGAGVAVAIAMRSRLPVVSRLTEISSFLGVSGMLAVCLWWRPKVYLSASFALYGIVLGFGAVALLRGIPRRDKCTFVAGIGLAWVTAISLGYNNPALVSGLLLLVFWRLLQLTAPANCPSRINTGILLPVACAVGLVFSHTRRQFPYLDKPASLLAYDAGAAFKGATGLRTNDLTFALLVDLQGLTTRFEADQRPYAVLTDYAAVRIRSPSRNPLPCEWPQETELGSSALLMDRVLAGLRAMPGNSRIIVQKFVTATSAWRQVPVAGISAFNVQHWVQANCAKVAETPFFEVYLPPTAPVVKPP